MMAPNLLADTLSEFTTERMRLTRPRAEDVPDYRRMFTDPSVMATLGGLRNEPDLQALIDRVFTHWVTHGFGLWIARDRTTGDFLGRGGLRIMMIDGRPEIELGYGLVPQAWGRGLATELARESVRVGFEVLRVPDIVCFTTPANAKSRRVMEKVGFTYERDGTFAALPHVFYRLRGRL